TIPHGLESPHALEYAAGVSRQFSNRIAVRSDFTYRDYRDFYSERIDTTTGTVRDSLGNPFDSAVIENTNALMRRYAGLTTSVTYRVSGRTDIGANYTLSRLWGNFDAENAGSGPVPATAFAYPQYLQASWAYPIGDLSADQRHRSAVWANYGVPRLTGMTLSVLETMGSGLPYGAVGQIDARPYVNNPGYITPQGAATENYYFTARDAFRTAATFRTDFAANYNYSVHGGSRRLDLFIQAQTINLFNQSQLCGCGGSSVFVNGGSVALSSIGQSVLTNSTTAGLTPFNPFTTAPVQGVNWNLGPNFGTAVTRTAYTSPRTFRLSFGLRF
ncbi:MAG TPA: hypothetical protein VLV86_15890, partial [Vicinamibacterales bacterium]|nr:hypothetical protein [Vicinamibacterales bacterium]